ncbi:MAG: hydroxymethylbilane synthase [Proteobacteria bacterium]|nr:hydroxymethylbilane synthase [Pseudomonadota bacterium]
MARAQSSAVARSLEQLHPGLKVELVGIDTRGDRILDTPLSQVDGKEFFTAEIDAALRAGQVDLTVHSFKDLSLERPAGLHLAAVPVRENPRDIVLFAADVPERLASGASLRIGSSSPRRQAFVPAFLERALPGAPRVELCELRGNVDTRLRRLLEPRGAERHLDGVILAFAGLARLWQDEAVGAAAVLRGLLAGLPRMLLPLTLCPTAPAQGALAIECRADDERTRSLLAALDDAATRTAVDAERALLELRGGGCQQRFGATQVQVDGLGTLLYQREANEQGPAAPRLDWALPPPPRAALRPWDGSQQAAPALEAIDGAAAECAQRLAHCGAAFIAHRRALPELPAAAVNRCRHIWVSGTESWFALAARGVWVEGCAESLGFAALRATLASPLLALPPESQWLALTNAEAAAGWGRVPVLATYRHVRSAEPTPTADAAASPSDALQVWWHSGMQFERWRGAVRADCQHACGPGRTAETLRRGGVAAPLIFPSVHQWREWLRT